MLMFFQTFFQITLVILNVIFYILKTENFQDGSMSHSVRSYTLDENNVLRYLNVIGTIEFQPFQALAESHHIFVK